MKNDDYPNHLCSTEAAGYGTIVLWSRDFYMSTRYPFSLLELPIFIGASDWREYRLSLPAIPALDVAMRRSSGKWDMAASRYFPNNWHMPLASFFRITFSILLRGMWMWWLPSWIMTAGATHCCHCWRSMATWSLREAGLPHQPELPALGFSLRDR